MVKLDGTEFGTLALPLTAVPYAMYAKYADNVDPAAIAAQIHDTANNVRNEVNTQVNNLETEINNLANSVDTAKANIRGEVGNAVNSLETNINTKLADTVKYALKSSLATVATSGNYDDLTDKPTIPAAQVNSDWNATSGAAEILNKPTNVSAFTNDAGYITGYTETQTLANVTAIGNSACNRQLKDVSDPTEAQDAVTKSYLAAQLGALASSFQHQLDSLGGVIEAQQRLLDSLINGDTTFTCGTSKVTDYDGNTYNTVQIGNQCWMKENMRTKHYADGTSVPAGGSNKSSTASYYYNYSSSSISLGQRGYLYNWSAAMRGAASSAASPSGVQGICPNGWHVPIDAEWTTMTNYVNSQSTYRCDGTSDNIAKALASTEWWETATGNCMVGNTPASNNETGFSAVPAGHYVGLSGSPFNNERYHALFWSTTQSDSSKAYYRNLRSNNAKVVSGSFDKYRGFSVRCLRD